MGKSPIEVFDVPNYAPLRRYFSAEECDEFMHIGSCCPNGVRVYLYKHWTRKYVAIDVNGAFYRHSESGYVLADYDADEVRKKILGTLPTQLPSSLSQARL
jgi:hypothetical protein